MRCQKKIKRKCLKSFGKSSVFCFVFMIFFYTCLFAGSYYVSTTGNDSNDGSIGSPWASLTHAISVAGPGDTILMRGGTYNTNEVWIRSGMGGASGQYLTIKNYPGEIPSVGGFSRIIISADYVCIEGLYFRLPYRISGASDWVQIVGNTFYGTQPDYGAIEFYPDNGLIEGNHIEITGGGGTSYHGIYLHYGKNNIVRNNYISGSSGYGIHVYDEIKSGDPPGLIKRYENIIIENNFVTSSQSRAGIIISAGESPSTGIEIDGVVVRNNIFIENYYGIAIRLYGTVRNVDILNNVIYNNNGDGLQINANDVDDITIKNNIFAFNAQRHINISNVNILDVSHNLYWQPASVGSGAVDTNAVYEDPLFVNANEGDFHLSGDSPAIDVGVDVGIPYLGTAPDIGAFEYDPSITSTEESTGDLPDQFNLQQNYPNPFNPSTEICYSLPCNAYVNISIFDVSGRSIKTLVQERQSAGNKTVKWNGKDENNMNVSSGIYFYILRADEFSGTRKMLLVR